jgi:hypothetical protein
MLKAPKKNRHYLHNTASMHLQRRSDACGLFDREDWLAELQTLNGPLPGLGSIRDCRVLPRQLKMIHRKQRKSSAGRRQRDVTLLFKNRVPQSLCHLSYDERDRVGDIIKRSALGVGNGGAG